MREVLKHWNINEPVKIKDIYYESRGLKAENSWIINEDFIFKISKNFTGLKQNIAFSKALKEAGLEAATPVPTKDNHDYFKDDEFSYYLTNRIKGDHIKSTEIYHGDYKSNARYLGEIIGKLHLVLKKQDKDLVCNEINLYENIRDWAIPEIKKYMKVPDSFYQDYLENFKNLYAHLPKQIIHRDPNPGNIIMKDGRFAGFIDFELSERDVRIYDPCYTATAILSESFDENDHDKLQKWLIIFKNIINGYDNVCKLSIDEKQAIPYMIFSIQMTCAAYFHSMNKYEALSKINEKMLLWLLQNKDALKFKKC